MLLDYVVCFVFYDLFVGWTLISICWVGCDWCLLVLVLVDLLVLLGLGCVGLFDLCLFLECLCLLCLLVLVFGCFIFGCLLIYL